MSICKSNESVVDKSGMKTFPFHRHEPIWLFVGGFGVDAPSLQETMNADEKRRIVSDFIELSGLRLDQVKTISKHISRAKFFDLVGV